MGSYFWPGLALETWLLILCALALFMLYGIWPYSFFKKMGIPGPRPLPFFGNYWEYRKGFLNFDQQCYQKYGKIWGIFDGRQPAMAILDPVIIKAILVKEFYTYFTNRRDMLVNSEIDYSIIAVKDDQWKRIRSVLSPTFTSGRLKEMFPIIAHYGELLVKNVQKTVEKGDSLDVKEIFGAYSMDVVTSTSFSINVDSMNKPNDPFVMHVKKFFSFSPFTPWIIIAVMFPFLRKVLGKVLAITNRTSFLSFFKDVISKVKKDRRQNIHTDRVDFLQLMVDSQTLGDTSDGANAHKTLTDREILLQAFTFIFAGYETTSTTLSFMAYCLALHPDVQQRLQEEIDEVFPNQAPLNYEAILQMEYLNMVILESLRLYPPVLRIERMCKDTVEVNGVTVPKGAVIMISAFILHRIPEYWPEPDEFRPERFNKKNKEAMDTYAYLPFGAGPRNCIGMRFALVVLKVALVVLLQKFSFRTCNETLIPMEFDKKNILKPSKPIKLKLVPRNTAEGGE